MALATLRFSTTRLVHPSRLQPLNRMSLFRQGQVTTPSYISNWRFYSQDLEISRYHEIADQTLEYITDAYENLAEQIPEIDTDLSQGVLTLVLPPNGTYVINKQPPNKQIWLSSPISGPKRYDYIDGKWVYHRDSSTLGALLKHETATVTQEKQVSPIDLSELD